MLWILQLQQSPHQEQLIVKQMIVILFKRVASFEKDLRPRVQSIVENWSSQVQALFMQSPELVQVLPFS